MRAPAALLIFGFALPLAAQQQSPDAPGPHTIRAATSSDGVRFVEDGPVFTHSGLVDPDVFWSGREWLMFVMALGEGTVMGRSADGLSFSYLGPLPMQNWGTTAPIRLPDGRHRLYSQAAMIGSKEL